MMTLRELLNVLPGTTLDFAEDSWLQVRDHNTSAYYREDELRATYFLGGERIKDTFSELIDREITCIEQNEKGQLEIYIMRR